MSQERVSTAEIAREDYGNVARKTGMIRSG